MHLLRRFSSARAPLRSRAPLRADSPPSKFEALVPASLATRASLASLRNVGYTRATPIQASALPPIFDGGDVIVAAETASGKTLCFALPCAAAVARATAAKSGARGATALVLVPSAELALQTAAVLELVGARPVLVRSGARAAASALSAGADVEPCTLVGTPASLAAAIAHAATVATDAGSGAPRPPILGSVRLVAMDEADALLGGSHRRDLEAVLSALRSKHVPSPATPNPSPTIAAGAAATPPPFRLPREGLQYIATAATLLAPSPTSGGAASAAANTHSFAHWAHKHLRHAHIVRSPRLHCAPIAATLSDVRISSDALRRRAMAVAEKESGSGIATVAAGEGAAAASAPAVVGGGGDAVPSLPPAAAAELLYPDVLQEARVLALLRALEGVFPQSPALQKEAVGVNTAQDDEDKGMTIVRFREDDGRVMTAQQSWGGRQQQPRARACRAVAAGDVDVDEGDVGAEEEEEEDAPPSELPQAVIFCDTPLSAARMTTDLRAAAPHLRIAALHSGLSHSVREGAFCAFQDGDADVLVATDVAARGLDTLRVALVINACLPESLTSFLHRAGRTGRAMGSAGRVTTLVVSPQEDARYAELLAASSVAGAAAVPDALAARRNASFRSRRIGSEGDGRSNSGAAGTRRSAGILPPQWRS